MREDPVPSDHLITIKLPPFPPLWRSVDFGAERISASSHMPLPASAFLPFPLCQRPKVPPPLPAGLSIGDTVYFTGPSQLWDAGNKLEHGRPGTVLGPALGAPIWSSTAEPVAVAEPLSVSVSFPGNKGPINIHHQDPPLPLPNDIAQNPISHAPIPHLVSLLTNSATGRFPNRGPGLSPDLSPYPNRNCTNPCHTPSHAAPLLSGAQPRAAACAAGRLPRRRQGLSA